MPLLLVSFASSAATPASTAPARIVAVGDLHGDFAVWRAIAHAAGLVDSAGHWTGGRTVLVQTGDVVDRGDGGKALIADLMRLQREAAAAGGRVIAMVGNHEAMNMTGDLRYVSPGDFAAYADAGSTRRREAYWTARRASIVDAYRRGDPSLSDAAIEQAWRSATPLGLIEHGIAWAADGAIGRWVAANPAVVVLGDTLFVHGGLSPAYDDRSVAQINRAVATALRARDTAPGSIINDEQGPLWYRGLATGGDGARPALEAALAAYHVRRLVIAHTPILTGIAAAFDGRLIRIDTGDAAPFGGTPSYLEIIAGTPLPHAVARPPAPSAGR